MAAALALLILVMAACGGGGGSSESAPARASTGSASADALVAPSASALLLRPGESAQLSARPISLVDGDMGPGTVEFVSEAPEIVRVGRDGFVEGLAVGRAAIEIRSPEATPATVEVEVFEPSAEIPTGPYQIEFPTPFLSLEAGATARLEWNVRDARGEIVSLTRGLEFLVSGEAGGDGRVEGELLRALQPGIVVLQARLAGEERPLLGQLLVQIVSADPPPTDECPAPEDVPVQYCRVVNPVFSTSRPGLSALVEVEVVRTTRTLNCASSWSTERVVAPSVRVASSEVLRFQDGNLVALREGVSGYTAVVDGVECGPAPQTVRGGVARTEVRVGLDMTGTWSGTCANGDVATIEVDAYRDRIRRRGDPLGLETAGGLPVGRATFCGPGGYFAEGTFLSPDRLQSGSSQLDHPCRPGDPCLRIVGHPAIARHGAHQQITGPDSFTIGSCSFRRGPDPATACELPRPVSGLRVQLDGQKILVDESPSLDTEEGELSLFGDQLRTDRPPFVDASVSILLPGYSGPGSYVVRNDVSGGSAFVFVEGDEYCSYCNGVLSPDTQVGTITIRPGDAVCELEGEFDIRTDGALTSASRRLTGSFSALDEACIEEDDLGVCEDEIAQTPEIAGCVDLAVDCAIDCDPDDLACQCACAERGIDCVEQARPAALACVLGELDEELPGFRAACGP